MEITEDEDKMMYIYFSKKRIDEYLRENDYRMAFNYLIFVLEKLENEERKELIEYYRKNASLK